MQPPMNIEEDPNIDYNMEDEEIEDEEMDDDEFDEMPGSDEEDDVYADLMNPPLARHGYGGRGRRPREVMRDILFNRGEPNVNGFMSERLRAERGEQRSREYGPNWSQEEEEASRILMNLRGFSQANPLAPPEPAALNGFQPTPADVNNRYRIELEVAA